MWDIPAVQAIGGAVAKSENPEDHEVAEEALQALFNFAVWSFLGTQMVMARGRSLKDLQPGEPGMTHAGDAMG